MKPARYAVDTSILIEMAAVRTAQPSRLWLACNAFGSAKAGSIVVPLPTGQEFIAGTKADDFDRRQRFLAPFHRARSTHRSYEIIENLARLWGKPFYANADDAAAKQAVKWDIAIVACALENGLHLCTHDTFQRDLYRLMPPEGGLAGTPDLFPPPQTEMDFGP